MASSDWSAKIGTGTLGVVADSDNLSSPNVMLSNATAAKAQYETVTGGTIADSRIEIGAKMTESGSTDPSLFLSLRSQSTAEDSDRYEVQVFYSLASSSVIGTTITIRRIVSTVATTISQLTDYTPPAGFAVSPPGGDDDYNTWKFEIATDGSTVRMRLQCKTGAGAYETVIDTDDSDGARITAAGRGRFGCDMNTADATCDIRFDDATWSSLT